MNCRSSSVPTYSGHVRPPSSNAVSILHHETTKSTELLALHRPVPASARLLGFRHTVPASGDRDKPRFFLSVAFRHPGNHRLRRRFREVATGLLRLGADATRDWRTKETKARPGLSGPNSFFNVGTQPPNIEKRQPPKLVGARWKVDRLLSPCNASVINKRPTRDRQFGSSKDPGPKNKTQPMKEPPGLQTTRTQHERSTSLGCLPFHRPAVVGTLQQQPISHLDISKFKPQRIPRRNTNRPEPNQPSNPPCPQAGAKV